MLESSSGIYIDHGVVTKNKTFDQFMGKKETDKLDNSFNL